MTQAKIYTNGPILTMTGNTMPEALLTVGERIKHVGSLEDCHRTAQGLQPENIDLQNMCLMPGFIDTHLHPLPMIFFAMNADMETVTSREEFLEKLQAQKKVCGEDQWIIAVQFEQKNLAGKETITARDLDEVSREQGMLVYTRDGHSVIVNSKVLEICGVTDQTNAPEGGTIERYGDGQPNGVFSEAAIAIPLQRMPLPDPMRMMEVSQTCFDSLAASGITSIGAMLQSDEEGPGGEAARFESMVIQALREKIPQSLYCIIIGKTLEGINAMIQSPMNDPDSRSITRAFKIFADGTFGSCTACMSEPYADKTCTHGYMTLSDDDLYSRMKAAHLADYQICIHAIGDKGIENCVDLYEKLLTEFPKVDHRHRIEHASIADPALIKRMADLNIIVATQPLFIRSEKSWLEQRLGPERCQHVYPFKGFMDAGVCVAGSSDAPIESTNVIAALDFAVNRGGFGTHQSVEVQQALEMYTVNAAYAQFEENIKGRLEAGMLADLVILDKNPLDLPKASIGELKVMKTVIAGQTHYDKMQES